jgi:hypothetical protein
MSRTKRGLGGTMLPKGRFSETRTRLAASGQNRNHTESAAVRSRRNIAAVYGKNGQAIAPGPLSRLHLSWDFPCPRACKSASRLELVPSQISPISLRVEPRCSGVLAVAATFRPAAFNAQCAAAEVILCSEIRNSEPATPRIGCVELGSKCGLQGRRVSSPITRRNRRAPACRPGASGLLPTR